MERLRFISDQHLHLKSAVSGQSMMGAAPISHTDVSTREDIRQPATSVPDTLPPISDSNTSNRQSKTKTAIKSQQGRGKPR